MKNNQDKEECGIICVYCNAPWTPAMEISYDGGSQGCDTCGYGEYVEISVEIHCETCGRLVYKKEGVRVKA